MSDTGKRIKIRRKELGISADKLAEAIGCSRTTVFRYENGDIYLGNYEGWYCAADWQANGFI